MRRTVWLVIWTVALAGAARAAATRPADKRIVARAYALRMAGQAEAARKLLAAYAKIHPNDASAHWELARTLFYLMDIDGAAEQAAAAVRLAPDNPRYLHMQGLACNYGAIRKHATNKPAAARVLARRAIAAWARALKLRPDFDDARQRLIGCYARLPADHGGDRAKAEALVKQAEGRDALAGALARCELAPTETEANISRLRKAMKASKPTAPGQAALAGQLARAGKFDEADAAIRRCIRLDPSRADVLLWVGRSYAWKKNHARADALFQRYLALAPPGPGPLRAWTLFARGVVRMRQGDREGAEALRKQAAKLDAGCWRVAAPPPRELLTAP